MWGETKWLRQGVEWQGIRKPAVMFWGREGGWAVCGGERDGDVGAGE